MRELRPMPKTRYSILARKRALLIIGDLRSLISLISREIDP
jgi:hypothetical protein